MPTAASTWSATVWKAVVHISSRSAPAGLDAAGGLGEERGDVVPATGPLQLGQLGELDAGEHEPCRVQPAEPLLTAWFSSL